jgi:predicted dehydrogenase
MNIIKLGYIGCGLAARDLHLPAVKKMSDKFRIVAASSRNIKNAGEFAELSGAEKFSENYHDILSDSNVDAVVVTYPFTENYKITKDVLSAGKHIMIEKPIAGTIKEAEEMVEWEEKSNLVTMLAENNRYLKSFTTARRYIDEGKIGKPCALVYSNISNYSETGKWLTKSIWRLQSPGGIMLDKESHYFASMRMLLGDIKSIIGHTGSSRPEKGPMDYATISMIFENGAVGTLHDFASVEGFKRKDAVIIGTKGTLFFGDNFESLTITEISGNVIIEEFENDVTNSFVLEFEDYYNCICTNSKPKSSFSEGYKDLQACYTGLMDLERWKGLEL